MGILGCAVLEWLKDELCTVQIKELEHALMQGNENCRDLKMEVSALQQQIIILKRDHRSSIATQTRFHDANMSSIARLKERLVVDRLAGRQASRQSVGQAGRQASRQVS